MSATASGPVSPPEVFSDSCVFVLLTSRFFACLDDLSGRNESKTPRLPNRLRLSFPVSARVPRGSSA